MPALLIHHLLPISWPSIPTHPNDDQKFAPVFDQPVGILQQAASNSITIEPSGAQDGTRSTQ